MRETRSRLRAPVLLSLITTVQVQRCYAHPFALSDAPDHTVTISEQISTQSLPPETVTISCSTLTSTASSHYGQPSNNPVIQLEDGQVQNPIPLTSPASTDISPSTTSTSSSLLSARGWTSNATSTPSTLGLPFTSTAVNVYDQEPSSFSSTISDSALLTLSTSEVQTATESVPTSASGSVQSSLQTSGNPTLQPLPPSAPSASTSVSLVNTATVKSGAPTASAAPSAISASNIFQRISDAAIPAQIPVYDWHPYNVTSIRGHNATKIALGTEDQNSTHRIETNKFYSGFYLGNQTTASYLFPYSVTWVAGRDDLKSWGIGVSQTERSQIASAPFKTGANGNRVDAGDWAWYANPLGVFPIILSAAEFNSTTSGSPGLTTEDPEWGAITVNLFPHNWLTPVMQLPLVQGASFITANYSWGTPLIQSNVGFVEVKYTGSISNDMTFKYTASLNDTSTWLLYITPNRDLSPDYPAESFTLAGSATNLQGHSGFNGLIQVAKLPGNSSSYSGTSPETLYDNAAGAFASNVTISGTVDGDSGRYTLSWTKRGNTDKSLMMFALPHHAASLSSETASGSTGLHLMTTVKGLATAVIGDSWTLEESDLPVGVGFAPWKPGPGSIDGIGTLSAEDKKLISDIGLQELQVDIAKATDLDSFYYAGKRFAKFASILWTQHQLVDNQSLVLTQLDPLKSALAKWINGDNRHRLVRENYWGGVISEAAYTDTNALADFGNGYYNDHHFHFGYFVYAAAVIAYLDPDWLTNGTNKAWIDTLVRDYANPIVDDDLAPFSRSFDWYHGHSWASGLFESADGKNQESSSEDTLSTYAIKMWGFVTKDKAMEARGNLMLAVQRRALNMYYLYSDPQASVANVPIQPPQFAGNKAAGILFENKIDHTTYFGALPEYIQDIHMIPVMPISSYIRTAEFVQQEWDAYFGNYTSSTPTPGTVPYIETINDGWRGITVADYCSANPQYGYEFFRRRDFQEQWLDGGASRTWYLAYCAALRGGS